MPPKPTLTGKEKVPDRFGFSPDLLRESVSQLFDSMQMYANGGTLDEHLQKVSIPTPAMLYLLRTWDFEMLLRLSLSAYYAFVSRMWGWRKPRSLSCRAAEPHVEEPVPGMVRWLLSSPCESSFLSFRTFPSASQPFWGCLCQGRPSVFLRVKT